MQRWTEDYLTDFAVEAARREFRRRGTTPPPYVAKDPDEPPRDEPPRDGPGSYSDLLQAAADLSMSEQVPTGLVEVAQSKVDGDLEAAAARLRVEDIPYYAVYKTRFVREDRPRRIFKLLVPSQFAANAREIISLVNSGAFSLGDDEIPGGPAPSEPR